MTAVVSRYRLKPKPPLKGPSGMSQPNQKERQEQAKEELDKRFPSQAEGEEEKADQELQQKEQQDKK